MKIKGIAWVGIKTDRFDAMKSFCQDVLGLEVRFQQPDFVVFRTANHDKLEIFGPKGPDPPAQFASNRVVCGFEVDDIDRARVALRDAGIELIGDLVRNSRTGTAWQHFRAPDGLVYELTYNPDPS